ncbi:Hypothetical predicted protein [Octopus vulgaris]|uniref:Uncharacterized protein n=1 Tax=Octopus vulgaris TaxID=6645 RepID=A0AA36AYP9_OCTVU|nr:Hypothetical predicted protein [Octopus vulgaris]
MLQLSGSKHWNKMGFNKALVVKRFSIDNWIDYGRAKYYLEKNDYDIKAATEQFNKELVQDENAKDLTLSRHLRIVKHTSKESEEHILMPGECVSVEGDNEIILLKEGDEGDDKEMKMDALIGKLPRLDVGKAKFFLDKCNWNLQVAQNLAELDNMEVSNAAEQMKRYPSQYIDIVDDQVVCRYYEDTGPEPESHLDLFYVLRERYHYTNGEAEYVLKKADWNFIVALHLSDLYVAYKTYGVYHYEFREKMEEFLNNVYKIYRDSEPLKDIVERMEEDSTFDRDRIAQIEFCKTYKLFKEKERTFKDEDIKKSFELSIYAAAKVGEEVPLPKGHKILQGEEITNDMKILAFTYWTSTDETTAKRILDKVKWNMTDAFKLDECLKNTWKPGHKTKLLKLAREYFGDIEKYRSLQKMLEDSPKSFEKAETEILVERFKDLPEYENFLNELFGRSYIPKDEVLKTAKQCFKTHPSGMSKFEKELKWFPDWIDFAKALELAENCFSKDYEDFLNELLYPPYLDTQKTKKLAQEYFEMHKDYKAFEKKLNEQPDNMSAEDIKKVAEEFFKGRKDFQGLLKELLDLPSFDKEKAIKLARKHFRDYTEYEHFKREIKKHPYSIKSIDAWKLVMESFKGHEDYDMFFIQLFSPREVQKERTMDVARKYYGYTTEYKKFEKDVNEYWKQFGQEAAKKLVEKHFKKHEGYKNLCTELDNNQYVDKAEAKALARKHCGYTKEYKEFTKEIDNYAKDFDGEDVRRLARKHFEDSQGCGELSKDLYCHTLLDKEETKDLARKHCGYTTQFEDFVKEATEGFNRIQAKRYAKKYFHDFKAYRPLLTDLDSEDIDKDRAKFIAKKHFGESKDYKAFEKKLNEQPDNMSAEDIKKVAEEFFKGRKEFQGLLKELLDLPSFDKEKAVDVARKHCGYTTEYKDFLKEVNDYPKAFDSIKAKKLAEKYFKGRQEYDGFLKNMNRGAVDKKRAKNLAESHFGNDKEYKDFLKEVNDYPEDFGRKHAKKLADEYFKGQEGYEDFCIELDNRDIDKDRAKILATRHFFDNQHYKEYLRDVDGHLEGFGLMETKKLAVRYFKGCKGYGVLLRNLNNRTSIDRKGAINLAEKYCGDSNEYEDFRRVVSEGFGLVEAKKLAEKYFKGCEGYENLLKVLDRGDIDKGVVENRVKEHFGSNEKYEDFKKEMAVYPESFGVVQARYLAKKYLEDREGYGDLSQELRIGVISRERTIFLAEQYCGYTRKYREFELKINKYTKDIRSEDAMKLVEKHFKKHEEYETFLKELFCLPNIDKERAKFLAKLYFGSYQEYKNFEKDVNDYPKALDSIKAKELAKEHFKDYKGYRNFSNKLYSLPKCHREDKDAIVNEYFGKTKEYRDFAEEIRNLPNGILKREAKNVSGKNFKCMQGLGNFWTELCRFPYIEKERAKKLAKKHFGSNKSYENFKKEMDSHPYSIKRKRALELVEKHFKEYENYKPLLKDLSSEDIDKERAKSLAEKYFGSSTRYICFVNKVNPYPEEFGREQAMKFAEEYFKGPEEYYFLKSKIEDYPEIIRSKEVIKLAQSYFEYNEEYKQFERDIEKLPSIIERQKFEKLNISQLIRCLGIWTGLDYGRLIYVYRSEENKLLWPTMKKLAVISSKHKEFKLDNYFLQIDLLIKEIENIVANIPRYATKKHDVTRLKGKNNVTNDITEGTNETRTDELVENSSGAQCIPVDLDLILYKNGVLFDGGMFRYDWLVNLRKALRGERPFKPQYMDKELRYNFQDRMDDRCPVDRMHFYLRNFYTKIYEEEDKREAKKVKAAAVAAKAAKAAEEAKIDEIIAAAVKAAAEEAAAEAAAAAEEAAAKAAARAAKAAEEAAEAAKEAAKEAKEAEEAVEEATKTAKEAAKEAAEKSAEDAVKTAKAAVKTATEAIKDAIPKEAETAEKNSIKLVVEEAAAAAVAARAAAEAAGKAEEAGAKAAAENTTAKAAAKVAAAKAAEATKAAVEAVAKSAEATKVAQDIRSVVGERAASKAADIIAKIAEAAEVAAEAAEAAARTAEAVVAAEAAAKAAKAAAEAAAKAATKAAAEAAAKAAEEEEMEVDA